MASPFAVFRRNQRLMLAVVGVLAMVAFVFLGPLMQYSGGRGTNPADDVVVETKYGPILRSGMENLVRTRELVDLFLRDVASENLRAALPGVDERLWQREAMMLYERLKQGLMSRYQQGLGAEHAALETYLLAKKAEEMNVVITNGAINAYLQKIVEPNVQPKLPQIIKSLGHQHSDVSQKQLFDALRTELMASKVLELFNSGLRVFTPAQRWEYYSRLNRGATAEVMTLPVDSFLEQVRQPTDKEIQAYFDEYKNQIQYPSSPMPGFKLPPKFDFQYFKVVFNDLIDESKVTDEEIEKYYEEHKDLDFRHREPAGDEKTEEKKADGEAKPAEGEAGSESPPADEKKAAKDGDSAADKKDAPAPEEKPSDANSDPKKAEPAETPKEKPDAKPAEKDKKKGAALERTPPQKSRTRVLLTSGPKQPDPAKAAPQPEKPGDVAAKPAAAKATDDKTDPAAAPEEDAAKSPESDTEPAKKSESEAKDSAKDSTATEKAESTTAKDGANADDKERKPAPPKYDPLDKVRDEIRKGIAQAQAAQKSQEISLRLMQEMRRAGNAARAAASKAKGGASDESLPKLDFDKLAKTEGVETERTGLLSYDELRETDIGKSYEDVNNRVTGAFQRRRFLEFAPSKGKFQQAITTDNDRNEYIFWKTDEAAEKVPSLDQVRKEVIRAWRLGQARELARKTAADDTKKAKEAGGSLEEIFGKDKDVKISNVGPFTWYTMGTAPSDPGAGQPRLSEVTGLEGAGLDFMKTVFSLAPGEYGWTLNETQLMAFVIRTLEFEPSMDHLRDDFAQTPIGKYWQVSLGEQSADIRNWLIQLSQEADVREVRPLDVHGQPAE